MATTPSTRWTRKLTHRECMDLLGAARAARVGMVSVDDTAPVRVICFPRPDGSVVIPTGLDRDLVSAATDRAVTVQFEQCDPDGRPAWVISGTGHARPIGRWDRPRTGGDTGTALVMRYAFENGIRVTPRRLTGTRARP